MVPTDQRRRFSPNTKVETQQTGARSILEKEEKEREEYG